MTSENDQQSTDPPPTGKNLSADELPFASLVRWLSLGERTVAAFFLFVILATMGVQVFARYVLKTPIQWSEEVARLALIWMTFTAAAFVMAEGRHITVDLISARLSMRGKLAIECLSHVIVTASCLLLLFGGIRFVYYVHKVGSPSLGIPMSWWYSAVSVGLLLMAIHSIVNLLQVLKTGQPTAREELADEEAFHLDMELGK